MTIFDHEKKPIAVTSTIITGRAFLHGAREISIPGFAIAAEDGQFLRALREGQTYLVELRGEIWHLYRVGMSGPGGFVLHDEPPLQVPYRAEEADEQP